MDKKLHEKLKHRLINISITQSVLRNQGRGIIDPIRKELGARLSIPELFEKIFQNGNVGFDRYLDELTNSIDNCKRVKWGTARKCSNIIFREIVYTGFFWQEYKLNSNDFRYNGMMNKLEVPLDSHVIYGLKNCVKKFNIKHEPTIFNSFRIKDLKKEKSNELQKLANEVAKRKMVCRVNLDLFFWRNLEEL
jgi:hypothetical protein